MCPINQLKSFEFFFKRIQILKKYLQSFKVMRPQNQLSCKHTRLTVRFLQKEFKKLVFLIIQRYDLLKKKKYLPMYNLIVQWTPMAETNSIKWETLTPPKDTQKQYIHGSIRRVREVSMEEHCFAYSFTKEYTIVLLLDLHPMYFQYQLSDGST